MVESFDIIAPSQSNSGLDLRIRQRESEQAERGALSALVYDSLHLFSSADESSLANLKAIKKGDRSGNVEVALKQDDAATDWRNELTRYTSTFIKTVPLFMGKAGYPIAGLINGLDQVQMNASAGEMALEFAAGATKGVALKYSMDKFSSSTLSTPLKGALLGGGSAGLDAGFNVRTWYDPERGLMVKDGLLATSGAMALGAGIGAVSFPLGAQIGKALAPSSESVLGGAIGKPLATSLVTGWSFGTVSGATAETMREIRAGETLDAVEIASRALKEGAVSTLAAGAGARFAKIEMPAFARSEVLERALDLQTASGRYEWVSQNPSRILDVAARLSSGEEVSSHMLEAVSENAELAKSIEKSEILPFLRDSLLSANPIAGLDMLMNTGAMAHIIPEAAEMIGPKSAQDPRWHPEGNVWEHVKLVMGGQVERTQNLPPEQIYSERLTAFLHDIAKPDTQKIWPDGGISNHKHDVIGAEKAGRILQALGEKPEVIDQVTSVVRDHMRMHETPNMRPETLNALLDAPFIEAKIRLQASDSLGTSNPERFDRNQQNFLSEKLAERRAVLQARSQQIKPLVNGHTLIAGGMKRGPEFRDVLAAARQAQIDGKFGTAEGANQWLAHTYGLQKTVAEPPTIENAQTPSALDATDLRRTQN